MSAGDPNDDDTTVPDGGSDSQAADQGQDDGSADGQGALTDGSHANSGGTQNKLLVYDIDRGRITEVDLGRDVGWFGRIGFHGYCVSRGPLVRRA